jgi:hypothetical protein
VKIVGKRNVLLSACRFLCSFSLVAQFVLAVPPVQNVDEAPKTAETRAVVPATALEIYPAVELTFQTQASLVYRLEVSTNLATWEVLATDIAGTGGRFSQMFSARAKAKSYYRLQIIGPDVGIGLALFWGDKIMSLVGPGQTGPIDLHLLSSAQYARFQGGNKQTGMISNAQRLDNSWTFNVTPSAGQQGAEKGVMRLNFLSANAGTWTFTPDGEPMQAGTFSMISTSQPPYPGNRYLPGKTLVLSYAGAGGESFQFITGTMVSYEHGTDSGTYVFDVSNLRLNVTLSNGSRYEITFVDGTNATVRFPGPTGPLTDTATYTLR